MAVALRTIVAEVAVALPTVAEVAVALPTVVQAAADIHIAKQRTY